MARRQHWLLWLVFVTALGVRCAHWWGQYQHNPLFFAPLMDEGKHHEWAQLIASGEGLGPRPYFRAPLYYYLLAGLYAVVGPNVALARALGCVLGAFTCYLIARLGITLERPAVGVLAGLLAAVYWPLIHFDALLLSVGLEVLLSVVLLLLLLTAAQRGSRWRFLAGGVVWGLSAITRPNVLALAPGILIWLWFAGRLGERPLRKRVAAVLVFAGMALIVLPVTLRNRIVGGEWVLIATNGGVNFYIGNNAESDGMTAVVPGTRQDWDGGYEDTHRIPRRELGRKLGEGEISAYWYRKGWEWIGADPAAWLALTWHKLRLFWSPLEIANNNPVWFHARMSAVSVFYWMGFPVVACMAVAGFVTLGGRWRAWSLLILFLAVYMGTVVAFFCAARYRLPIVPVLCLLAAHGLVQLPSLWRRRGFGRLAAYGVAGGLAALSVASNPPWPRDEYRRQMEGMAHYNLGMHYLRPGGEQPAGWRNAVEQFEQAVRLRPLDGDARLGLAQAQMWLGVHDHDSGDPDRAEERFAAALALAPNRAELRTFYAEFLRLAGRLGEAVEQGQVALALDPDDFRAHYELGLVRAVQQRHDEAVVSLRRALAAARLLEDTELIEEVEAHLQGAEQRLGERGGE